MSEYHIEIGKRIGDISSHYPTDYEDAAIIYEEWCKGILTECRPNRDQLRKYAKYNGNIERWFEWIMKGKP